MTEYCKEWPKGQLDKCNKPARYILWGKLFDPEALGPRCWDCASKHLPFEALNQNSWKWAVYKIPEEKSNEEANS